MTPDKTGNNTLETTINASNVSQLKLLFNVALPASDNPDGPPVLLTGVSTPVGVKDLVFVQGTQGHITAFDAHTGAVVWTKAFASPHANNATAAIDPNRQFVYINTATQAHKLNVGDGSEVTAGGWPETTSAGAKTSCQLTIATAKNGSTYLYCANQGVASITTINLNTGTQHVFNLAASDQPDTHSPTQMESGANPWSRGMAYDASLDRLFVGCGTNNGPDWIPGHVWRQSYLALAADGSTQVTNGLGWPVDSYTPTNWAASVKSDQDICSGGLGILPVGLSSKYPHLGVNPGKDHNIRILNLANMSGQGGPGHTGGELFLYSFSAMSLMRAECCVWTNPADGHVWVFASGNNGIAGFKVVIDGSGNPSLSLQWSNIPGGIHWTTSSFVANNVLYAAVGGGEDTSTESPRQVQAINPTTGAVLWTGAIDEFHWASPILANGILYMADGNSGGFSGPGGHLRAWSLGTTPPPPVADPTFSPPAGNYSTAQSVTISTTTSGASIRYTLDGSIPSETAGALYSGPVTIGSTTTLKAIAYKSGMSDSNVVLGNYTISGMPVVAAPSFNPPGGTYTGTTSVSLTTSTSNASIRYTTDGSTPSETNGTLYSGTAVSIGPGATTLQAIAYESGFTDSSVTSATYTVNPLPTTETYEAEDSGHTTSGPLSTIESDPNASNGEWVSFNAAAAGDYIEYNIGTAGGGAGPLVPAGTYTLSMRYPTGSNFGTLSLLVDGAQIGGTLDEYAAASSYQTVTFGTVSFATTDNHIIRLTATGKNSASSGFVLSADSFTFTPAAAIVNLEAESMSPVGTGATVSISNDVNASGGVVEFLNSTAANQSMTLTTPSITAGTYQVQLRYSVNKTRGQHTVKIDGVQVGGTIDQYAASQSYVTTTLGNATIGSGTHTIVLTVTGKNSAATQYYITADKFTLTPQSGGGSGPAAAPVFSPAGGTYSTAQMVTITSSTGGASIRYTTNGTAPTETNGTLYSAPVNISATTTLQAIAYESGFTDSP
ncbi:MAG TPA: chitobiase/beta-hexosaminidase C-terminal domain-containing protein, partial [Opitutaceae bacterium]|nr:chitobiase/beta-hexosaminidase C-terminal domain-containing protein [Opitutaceae bacterium]